MPKQKRRQRVQVALDPEVHDLLNEFAALTGRTKAGICEELITESVPAVHRMIHALSKIEVDTSQGLREMADLMLQAAAEARQMGLELEEGAK